MLEMRIILEITADSLLERNKLGNVDRESTAFDDSQFFAYAISVIKQALYSNLYLYSKLHNYLFHIQCVSEK